MTTGPLQTMRWILTSALHPLWLVLGPSMTVLGVLHLTMIALCGPLLTIAFLLVLRLLIARLEYFLLMTAMQGRLSVTIVALHLRTIATCDLPQLSPYKMFRCIRALQTGALYEGLRWMIVFLDLQFLLKTGSVVPHHRCKNASLILQLL
jgi:hypothetical protein